MNLTMEKSPVKEYAIEEQKKYEFEKQLQKSSTHIFIKKESEYSSVNRVVKNFKKSSAMEFETLFKLYKFQNYKYSPEYLIGTSYKYGTLNCLSTYIKAATKGLLGISKGKAGYATAKLVYDFIEQIKSFSTPFAYIFPENEPKKGIKDLLESEILTKEEIDFVVNKIEGTKKSVSFDELSGKNHYQKYIKPNKEAKREKETNSKEKNMAKRSRYLLDKSEFMIIANNYKLGATAVGSLLPHLNKKTVFNYVRSCKLLENNIVPERTCPEMLKECFNEVKNTTLPITSFENVIKPKKVTRKTQKSETKNSNTQYIIIDRSNNIVKMSDNEMFIKGYKEGSKNKSWKVYKIVEV